MHWTDEKRAVHQEWKLEWVAWVEDTLKGKELKCKDGFSGIVSDCYWIYSETFWLVFKDGTHRPLITMSDEEYPAAIPSNEQMKAIRSRLKPIDEKMALLEALE